MVLPHRIRRWIITGRENATRRIVIYKRPRKIKGSGKEERIQNYSGSHSAKERGRYKASGKTRSDENDPVSKTRSDESYSTRKTGSDENSPVGKTRSNDNGSVGKTGSLRKTGPRTTAPPRDQAKAELGIAISAISAIILTAFIGLPTDGTQALAGTSFVWNSPHSSGEGKRAI